MQLWLQPVIATASQSLVLHVGSDTFAFKDADGQTPTSRVWNNSGLSWTTGDAIGLKLTEAANATGDPTISGVPQVGMVLEAKMGTIADTNGLPSGTFPSDYTFQWVRVATDSTETNLGTDSTYMVSSSDVDSTIRVDVSFTDLAGNSEGPLPSVATAAVVPAAGLCPAGNDWCATMTVGTAEAAGTYYGFFFGGLYGQLDETTIDYGHSFEVEEIYIYETESLVSDDRIHIALDADVPLGTVFNLGGTEFTSDAGSRVGSGTHIWSRPANFAWIDGQEVKVSANLAPAPESATVDGTSLVLTHSEDLNTGSVPAASAYTVKVDGDAGTNPSTVSVGTRTVTLTLATAVTDGQMVTVSYGVPTSNPLQDVSGRKAPAFTDLAVTTVPTSLVSNTHLSVGGFNNLLQAQSFETGANLDGYTVSEVDIRTSDTSGSSTSVRIRKNNADNEPGDLVATLANPTSLTDDSLNTFTAPAGTTLAASTTYWITTNEEISSNKAQFALTNSDDETGEPDWTIGDDYLWKSRETNSWSTNSRSLLMTIKGTVVKGTAVSCDGIWCATLQVQDLGRRTPGLRERFQRQRVHRLPLGGRVHPRHDRQQRHGGARSVQRTVAAVDAVHHRHRERVPGASRRFRHFRLRGCECEGGEKPEVGRFRSQLDHRRRD